LLAASRYQAYWAFDPISHHQPANLARCQAVDFNNLCPDAYCIPIRFRNN
jgi:endogenous inhibitor of DNA gyrase (YacG/DUF329 family)